MFRRSLIVSAVGGPAWAQDRPVRMIVPFLQGGTTDSFARRVAGRMQAPLGQPVTVVNQPGRTGVVGTMDVVRARPDGQTILFVTASTLFLHGQLSEPSQFRPLADLAPVSLVGTTLVVFAVRPDGASGLAALLDAAREHPLRIRHGSPSVGSYLHLTTELLKREAGRLQLTHTPYGNSRLATQGLARGEVDFVTATLANTLQAHRQGEVRIVAVASAGRSPLLPEVPTVAECLSLPSFEAALWMALMLPAGGPVTMRDRLAYAINSTLANGPLRSELAQSGFEVGGLLSPPAITAFLRAEQERWLPIVQAIGARPG